MKSLSMAIQVKPHEQYFPVVLFIVLYKMVLTFESKDKILKCNHPNERYGVVLFCVAVYCEVKYRVVLACSLKM